MSMSFVNWQLSLELLRAVGDLLTALKKFNYSPSKGEIHWFIQLIHHVSQHEDLTQRIRQKPVKMQSNVTARGRSF